jgi:hypothetical protein
MTKTLVLLTLLLTLGLSAQPAAQTCTGTAGHFFQWGDADAGAVYSPVVPATETWLVDAAGLFTSDNGWADNTEWMMEVIEPVPEQTGLASSEDVGRCCWRIPLIKQLGSRATPLAALNRPIILRPGQRMAGRTNGSGGGRKFGIDGIYWRFPASCGASLATGILR